MIRIKNKLTSPIEVNTFPFASTLLYLIFVSPFFLSVMFVFVPYVLDDYAPSICLVTSVENKQGSSDNFYAHFKVNYTFQQQNFQGIYEGCRKSNVRDRNECVIFYPANFTCMVDSHYSEQLEGVNYVLLDDELKSTRLKFTAIFASVYVGAMVIFSVICLTLFLIDPLMECCLPKLSDKELRRNLIQPYDYKLKLGKSVSDKESATLLSSTPFKDYPKIYQVLFETASEKEETIEWTFKPKFYNLMFSPSWSVVTFLLLFLLPVLLAFISFGLYFVIQYHWVVLGIVLLAVSISYSTLIYLLFVLVYLVVANGTTYYLTTSRTICIMRCFFTTWIYQFHYNDIDSLVLQGYDSGALSARSKSLKTEVKLFSFVPNMSYVENYINMKMTEEQEYTPRYESYVERF